MVQGRSLQIAQITDVHLFAEADQRLLGLPTSRSFEVLIEQLHNLSPKPDLLLLTGDLSQDGTSASYQRLQRLLSPLNIPTYWLPGNHDCPEVMEVAINHPLFPSDKSFQIGNWRFVLLNSQDPGYVHGRLSDEGLMWLDRELRSHPDLPALVALHHPPFTVNSTWLDTSVLQNSADLFEVLDRHAQVKLVVFGHIHQEFCHQRNGVTYLGTPSTCIQFEPNSVDFSLGQQEPGFRLIQLYSNGDWNSQAERISYTYQLDLAATGY
jgi:Icc protein